MKSGMFNFVKVKKLLFLIIFFLFLPYLTIALRTLGGQRFCAFKAGKACAFAPIIS